MLRYNEFKKAVRNAADAFNSFENSTAVRLVSHLDSDGICATSILIKTLQRSNRQYSLSIVQQLDDSFIQGLFEEDYSCFIFTDIGSGKISEIKRCAEKTSKTAFVLDHHSISSSETYSENIIHVNPHLFGIDGGREISGSGVVFMFSRAVNEKNKDLAYLAVIGAIGDVQEDNGFLALNKEILDAAVETKKIKVINGLRLFGVQTRPLHKVLEYSSDPFIPGVSGSESSAINFLNQLGIKPQGENGWTKLVHLDKSELQRLVAGIILRRSQEDRPEDILGNVYLLRDEPEESPTKDAREFSTLLNACGRLDRASMGIAVCLNDPKLKKEAIKVLDGYKKEIVTAINWFHENKTSSEDIISGRNFVLINAKDRVLHTIAGTLASILSKSGELPDNTFILSLARNPEDNTTKVSLRVSGRNPKVDLQAILSEIAEKAGGSAGGHKMAAGAIIPLEKEQEFIKEATKLFDNIGSYVR